MKCARSILLLAFLMPVSPALAHPEGSHFGEKIAHLLGSPHHYLVPIAAILVIGLLFRQWRKHRALPRSRD